MKKNKVIIFDLDGVLINSAPNMRYALNQTSKKMNINLQFSLYKNFLGLPFEKIIQNMGIYKDVNLIKRNYEYFSKQKLSKIKIKKKFLLKLNQLKKKYYLAVFTSKNRSRTKIILSEKKLFDCIITADDVSSGKPNPQGLKKILKLLKLKPNNCLYIGDSIYDYKASKLANIKYRHASWGYDQNLNKKKFIKKIKNLSEIEKIL